MIAGPRPGEPTQARTSFGRTEFSCGRTWRVPRDHRINRIRESSGSPWTPRADANATLPWDTTTTVRPSDTQQGVPDGKGQTDSTNSIGSVGNTGTLAKLPGKSTARGKTEVDCLQTVRCMSTEPADTNNPITTHTPARPQAQHHQTDHTPQALLWHAGIWRHRVAPRLLR